MIRRRVIIRRPWTLGEIADAVAALKAGDSLSAVAARFLRTKEAVRAMARRQGVSRG